MKLCHVNKLRVIIAYNHNHCIFDQCIKFCIATKSGTSQISDMKLVMESHKWKMGLESNDVISTK